MPDLRRSYCAESLTPLWDLRRYTIYETRKSTVLPAGALTP